MKGLKTYLTMGSIVLSGIVYAEQADYHNLTNKRRMQLSFILGEHQETGDKFVIPEDEYFSPQEKLDTLLHEIDTKENKETRETLEDQLDKALRNFVFEKSGYGYIRIDGYAPVTISHQGIQSGEALYTIYAPGQKDETPTIKDIHVAETGWHMTLQGTRLFFSGEKVEKVSFASMKQVLGEIMHAPGTTGLPKQVTFPTNDGKPVYLVKK